MSFKTKEIASILGISELTITIDPEFRSLIPPLTSEERLALEVSIVGEGCRDPIVLWGDVIVDGHNRHEICTAQGISFETCQIVFSDRLDAMIWIRRNQVTRRNLTDDQRLMNREALRRLESEKARQERARKAGEAGGSGRSKKNSLEANVTSKLLEPDLEANVSDKSENQQPAKTAKRPPKSNTRTRAKAAAEIGQTEHRLRNAAFVIDAAPELAAKVQSGEMPLAAAVREVKRAEIVRQLESVEAKEQKALAGEYDVIVIDPPWPMQKIERDVAPNQVAFEYPVMKEHEIAALKMPAADDCHMWLWTTHKFLPMALRLLDVWKFEYVCTFVWHKPGGFQPFGLPQYNCEFALYARKGSPKFIDTKALPVCFNAPRGAHSEKPEQFYDVVRRVTAGRRIDIFNRRAIDGFDVWGKESPGDEGIKNAS